MFVAAWMLYELTKEYSDWWTEEGRSWDAATPLAGPVLALTHVVLTDLLEHLEVLEHLGVFQQVLAPRH